jgi:predicted dehydrogenase
MSDKLDDLPAGSLKRRDFLAAGALPVAAALSGSASMAQTRAPQARKTVRVGLIGAGDNVQKVMIPGFRRIPECELLGVANTSLASSQRVASQFKIPKPYANWKELVDDPDIDAVCIGTWPYMHHTVTLAALDKGKHVLCQARLANNAQEAREMLAASQRRPDLVCQLVPTSTSYRVDNLLKKMIRERYIGEVLSVEIQRLERSFADPAGELDWRHNAEYSGFNVLNAGSTYESMMRWLGSGTRVMAMSKVHVPFRRGPKGEPTSVSLPDHLDILYELPNGAQVHMRVSETTGLSQGNQTWIHGREGTIFVDGRQSVFAGHRGDKELTEIPNPPNEQTHYRVEEEFINAVRGLEPVTMNTFETGVHYMEWTEAVYRSAQSGQAVHLPL